MRKVIVAINTTLDGFCDHTEVIADDELHNYFNKIMAKVDTLIMGRTTYQLMEGYWPKILQDKSGSKAELEFAEHMNRIEKVVVSTTLDETNWGNTRIVSEGIIQEIERLKVRPANNISIGGPSLISYLMSEHVIDEIHLVVHPVILGQGTPLISHPISRIDLELLDTTKFKSGVIASHYQLNPHS